jgi:hypothetical protein
MNAIITAAAIAIANAINAANSVEDVEILPEWIDDYGGYAELVAGTSGDRYTFTFDDVLPVDVTLEFIDETWRRDLVGWEDVGAALGQYRDLHELGWERID